MSKVRYLLRAACVWLSSLRPRCECCGKPVATRRRQRTAYADEPRNWVTLCARCHVENDAYWDERWADYYGGLL